MGRVSIRRSPKMSYHRTDKKNITPTAKNLGRHVYLEFFKTSMKILRVTFMTYSILIAFSSTASEPEGNRRSDCI